MKFLIAALLFLSSTNAFADTCEISMQTPPNSATTLTSACLNSPSHVTEYASREEATHAFLTISASWSAAKWTMTGCRNAAENFYYGCTYQSPESSESK